MTNSPNPAQPWRGQTGEYSPLVSVRSAHQAGFDRLVFEFAGPVPGYLVSYGPPVLSNTADQEVTVRGAAGLQLWVFGGGNWMVGETVRRPANVVSDTTAITEAVFVEDFEAVMRWLVGVDRERPFVVTTLSSPTRIVIDVEAP